MRKKRQPSLRGSVTQNAGTVRMRASNESRFGMLVRPAVLGCVLILLILFGYIGWHGGWLKHQAADLASLGLRLTQSAHFAVEDIVVEGREHTDKDQLAVALGASRGSPIFAFDPRQAEAQITKLPWVETVTVERRLPDTIFVRMAERMPLARWQNNNRTSVIDIDGKILPNATAEEFSSLPLVVGVGAPQETKSLLATLHEFPAVDSKVEAAVRVGERRWDLFLQPKVVAHLPENDIGEAIKSLSILITEKKVLERDVTAIDLRIPDRLIIESGTSATPPNPPNIDNRL